MARTALREVSNFLAPTRSRGRPLPHWKISGPKSLGLGSFFLPELRKGVSAPGLSEPRVFSRPLRASRETLRWRARPSGKVSRACPKFFFAPGRPHEWPRGVRRSDIQPENFLLGLAFFFLREFLFSPDFPRKFQGNQGRRGQIRENSFFFFFAWIPLLPLISPGNFREIRWNLDKFGKNFREKFSGENSVEFSMEFSMGFSMNSVGIPGGFRGNAGFSGKLGVWGGFGRFGGSKGFCANSHLGLSFFFSIPRIGIWEDSTTSTTLGEVHARLPRGPCETDWCLAAKIVSPLSRGNFWLATTLAQIVS